MLIWDIIRDWFVMNIWGGCTAGGDFYSGHLGPFIQPVTNGGEANLNDNLTTSTQFIKVGSGLLPDIWDTGADLDFSGAYYMSLGDWLSTISTIIILVAVSVGLFFLVRYFFRMFSGLLSGR